MSSIQCCSLSLRKKRQGEAIYQHVVSQISATACAEHLFRINLAARPAILGTFVVCFGTFRDIASANIELVGSSDLSERGKHGQGGEDKGGGGKALHG